MGIKHATTAVGADDPSAEINKGEWNADHAIDDSVVFPKTSGVGIKVDTASPAFGWQDILGDITVRGSGANDPAWTQIASGPFYAYNFAVNKECWISFHIPHDYAPGTSVAFHTHYTTNGTNVNTVRWEFVYTHAKGHNQAQFSTTGTTVTVTQAPTGTAWTHLLAETALESISGLEPDSIVYVRLRRITNGGTDNTDTVFLLQADMHYQSTALPTKNRTPNFYT